MGLEIKRNSLVIGENLGKVYGAVRYPQKVDMGWLSKITNIPSTIVSVGITPIDNGALISAISKSIVQQRGAADSAKDPLTRQRAEKAAEDGERIMQRIDQEGETVAMMSLTVMPIAQDEANFTKVCRRVESAFNIQKCKVRTLANLQKEGFQSISPTYPANSTVDSIVSRIIPMSTFVALYQGIAFLLLCTDIDQCNLWILHADNMFHIDCLLYTSAPLAIRALRLGLRSFGFRLSSGVME